MPRLPILRPILHALLGPLALVAMLFALPARAEVARVATDIAPVHSLVSAVMGELGTPSLILAPGASPHDHSMRPSEAGALADADLVFWVGPALTPWLEGALDRLAGKATVVTLSQVDGVVRWPARQGIELLPVESSLDAHLWLDPDNGAAWIEAIRAALSAADPQNGDIYDANAAKAQDSLIETDLNIRAMLSAHALTPYLAVHDSWQYFERHFDLAPRPAILDSEADRPGPAYLLALQDLVKARDISCVLAEPPVNQSLIRTVFGSREVSVKVADPLGASLAPGPDLYGKLLSDIGRAISSCGTERPPGVSPATRATGASLRSAQKGMWPRRSAQAHPQSG